MLYASLLYTLKEMLFTGRLLTTAEALQCGFLTAIVNEEQLLSHVAGVAQQSASLAPLTIWAVKEGQRRLSAAQRAIEFDDVVGRILRDLAGQLAIADFFPWQDEEEYLYTLLAPQRMEDGRSLTVEQLRRRGGIWQKSRLSHVAYPDHRFHTPSGKVEFWSERAQRVGLSPLPTYTPPQIDADPNYPLHFRQGRTMTAFHAFYDEGRALPSLARANVEPELWIHPSDAQQRAIVTGSPVQVYNARGSIHAKAKVTEAMQPGVVWMRDGWFGVNSLTNGETALSPLASDLIDPYMIPGGQAAFDARVEVCPLPAQVPATP